MESPFKNGNTLEYNINLNGNNVNIGANNAINTKNSGWDSPDAFAGPPSDTTTPTTDTPAPNTPTGIVYRDPIKDADTRIIKLVCRPSLINRAGEDEVVYFDLTPEITESNATNYIEISDIRQAGSFFVYMGSVGRTYSMTAQFLSRTMAEATRTWQSINLLRSWTKPDVDYDFQDRGIPHIVQLYGYGKTFKGIPVIVTEMSANYPKDVDYVKTSNGSDVPILQTITLSLRETRSLQELVVDKNIGDRDTKRLGVTLFDLNKFKEGRLDGW